MLVSTKEAALCRVQFKKAKGAYSSSWDFYLNSYGASPAVQDHSVTCHPTQVNALYLHPSHVGCYSIHLPPRDGRLR